MNQNELVKVIIVDDDLQSRYLLEMILKNEKFDVTCASNGKIALQYLKENEYDLIISDILMPVLDGFQLCRECKKDPSLKKIPFVFYTATYVDEQDEKFALNLGADRFVLKPTDPADFMIIIKEVILQYTNNQIMVREDIPVNEKQYLQEHNKRLAEKLESKIILLENTNKALIESEENLRIIIEKNADSILIINKKGFILYANKKAEEIYNKKSDILIGSFFGTIDSRKTQQIEIPGENNNTIFIETNCVEITWKNEKVYLATLRDITERKKSEKMLIEAEKMKEIAQLSAGVAHEFNNILTVIKSFSQLLLLEEDMKKITLDEKIKEGLSIIDEQTNRGAAIVSNLMLFARPGTLEKKYGYIHDIIDDVLKLQKKQCEIENIEIIKNYNDKKELLLNSGQIQQVFLNFLVNARHAITPKGKGRIIITTESDTENVIITFSDNGIGMSNEIKENIFKPFFTTKGANANDDLGLQGTGLGLAVSSNLIKEHNGSISVDSEPDNGTIFKIILPFKAPDLKYFKIDNKEIITEKGYKKDIKILIVDDEMNIADNIAGILGVYGFKNIDISYSAVETFNKVKNNIYELFFIDLLMPEIKGDVLVNKLLNDKKFSNSNIIVMSGSSNNQMEKIISSCERCFFLGKPFNHYDMLKILNNIFSDFI